MGRMERIMFYVVTALLLISVLLFFTPWLINKDTDQIYTISVLMGEGNDNFRRGMDRAALDYNAELIMVSTAAGQTAQEQIALLQREFDSGADAAVLEPVDTAYLEQWLESARLSSPLIIAGYSADSSKVISVAPDGEAMGRLLAEQIIAQTYGQRVYVLLPREIDSAQQLRLTGLTSALKEADVAMDIYYVAVDEISLLLREGANTGIYVAFEHDYLEEICRYAGESASIYGTDFSGALREACENGKVGALVVNSDYLAGYLCVARAATAADGQSQGDVVLENYVVNGKNIYEYPISDILFPAT